MMKYLLQETKKAYLSEFDKYNNGVDKSVEQLIKVNQLYCQWKAYELYIKNSI